MGDNKKWFLYQYLQEPEERIDWEEFFEEKKVVCLEDARIRFIEDQKLYWEGLNKDAEEDPEIKGSRILWLDRSKLLEVLETTYYKLGSFGIGSSLREFNFFEKKGVEAFLKDKFYDLRNSCRDLVEHNETRLDTNYFLKINPPLEFSPFVSGLWSDHSLFYHISPLGGEDLENYGNYMASATLPQCFIRYKFDDDILRKYVRTFFLDHNENV